MLQILGLKLYSEREVLELVEEAKQARRKYTEAEAERLYQIWKNGGPCPWTDERDYRRKWVAERERRG